MRWKHAPELASGWDFSRSRNTFKKYKKNFWLFTVFWPSEFFRDFLKSPEFLANPLDSGFFFLSLEIFIPGILVPGIRDFRKIPGIRDFFRGMGYPDKKPPMNALLLSLSSTVWFSLRCRIVYALMSHSTNWPFSKLKFCNLEIHAERQFLMKIELIQQLNKYLEKLFIHKRYLKINET